MLYHDGFGVGLWSTDTPSTRSCRSVGLLERLQLQVESRQSMLFEIRKPECVL